MRENARIEISLNQIQYIEKGEFFMIKKLLIGIIVSFLLSACTNEEFNFSKKGVSQHQQEENSSKDLFTGDNEVNNDIVEIAFEHLKHSHQYYDVTFKSVILKENIWVVTFLNSSNKEIDVEINSNSNQAINVDREGHRPIVTNN